MFGRYLDPARLDISAGIAVAILTQGYAGTGSDRSGVQPITAIGLSPVWTALRHVSVHSRHDRIGTAAGIRDDLNADGAVEA